MSKLQLLLATRNAHKTREFGEILGAEFKIVDLSTLPTSPELSETGATFRENAILKAVTISRRVAAQNRDQIVIADDSGLEVDALKGAPGVYSARYAGVKASDQQNVAKLRHELANVPLEKRTARFRCVIALARAGGLLETFEGTVEGKIVDLARGKNGFGYDPIFVPNGFDKTFAELLPETKNRISHRAIAIAQLHEALNQNRFANETRN